jgi:hypothetical protein
MAIKRASTSPVLSISGLSTKAQEDIAKAARKQRRSVNSWAASTLKTAAQSALADGSASVGPDEVLVLLKRISRKIDKISTRPNLAEETLSQAQARLHEMSDRLGTVFDEVRERGGETIDEVREHGSEITEKAGETFVEWRKVADGTIQDLQRNLSELQRTLIDKVGLAPAQKPTDAKGKKSSGKKRARARSVPNQGPSKAIKKAKPTAKKKSPKSKGRKK